MYLQQSPTHLQKRPYISAKVPCMSTHIQTHVSAKKPSTHPQKNPYISAKLPCMSTRTSSCVHAHASATEPYTSAKEPLLIRNRALYFHTHLHTCTCKRVVYAPTNEPLYTHIHITLLYTYTYHPAPTNEPLYIYISHIYISLCTRQATRQSSPPCTRHHPVQGHVSIYTYVLGDPLTPMYLPCTGWRRLPYSLPCTGWRRLPCSLPCIGWRRLIGSPKLQIIFHKRATRYRSLLRKTTYKDMGSYGSSPPCMYAHISSRIHSHKSAKELNASAKDPLHICKSALHFCKHSHICICKRDLHTCERVNTVLTWAFCDAVCCSELQ